MTLDRTLRLALAFLIVIGLALLLVALLLVTESVLEVWARLRDSPRWLVVVLLTGLGTLVLASGWAVWRLLFPRKSRQNAVTEVVDEESLIARLEQSSELGMDISAAQSELATLAQRRAAGDFRVALFGEVSTGKSALIRALLPEVAEQIEVSARGGSTRQLTDYQWTSPAGDRLILTDVPGLNEPGVALDGLARDEALRAHAVVFVADNDLTREQYAALSALYETDKPLIVALNKADRFPAAELARLQRRLNENIDRLGAGDSAVPATVVAISAAPGRKILRVLADGTEQHLTESAEPQIGPLRNALQDVMDRDPALMEELRDASVFVLTVNKLNIAEAAFREQRSAELISSYTRKAVVGALAAVMPGTDVLIQGYLGANFVRELCELYGVTARDIDVKQFLKLSQKHIGRAMPLMLAIGGNALKAFPGVGTVAGGLMHAVAYGLIFDALGHSLSHSLSETGGLRPVPAASQFRKELSENLEKRTASMAKLALEVSRQRRES